MARIQVPPSADINTPDELLANAERHYASTDLNAMRAAVLEAMAAFETFVQGKVFSSLEGKFDLALVSWLEKKTRTDFDSRLSVLAPVALGRPIDKQDALWRDYETARSIRHRVVHAGARVTREKARFVIDTVYKWLAFLGSSVEVQVALLGLKRFFERHPAPTINDEREAVDLVVKYFSKTKTAEIIRESYLPGSLFHPDVILKFGPYTVIIEAKFFKGQAIGSFIRDVTRQLTSLITEHQAASGAVVVFFKGQVDPAYKNILVLQDGKLFVLVIPVY
jgi:hypothetical protein